MKINPIVELEAGEPPRLVVTVGSKEQPREVVLLVRPVFVAALVRLIDVGGPSVVLSQGVVEFRSYDKLAIIIRLEKEVTYVVLSVEETAAFRRAIGALEGAPG